MDPEPGDHLQGIGMVRRHGFEHRPALDPPLLHTPTRVALRVRRPVPSREPRNHTHDDVEWNTHEPFTGETQTINGLVTTTETTGPFPLSHLVINNTDTWEEKQGH